ncbi:LIM domain protein [Ancylostoma duodenale]|uniref:LIM domain protein n=1 Tax=Ancylostoma duodenale TaxID=51022 RepID=A0A0C2D076_9BILA|nr:LIM domain protein [Ancylostoma duodenale]
MFASIRLVKSVILRFEKGVEDSTIVREKVEIERSADMQKMKSAFNRDMTADEAPKDCAVCGKTVYPVERIFANKQLYHNQCFKCAKCEKKLTTAPKKCAPVVHIYLTEAQKNGTFRMNSRVLDCMIASAAMEDEHGEDMDDDDEFAVTNKPKHLQGSFSVFRDPARIL